MTVFDFIGLGDGQRACLGFCAKKEEQSSLVPPNVSSNIRKRPTIVRAYHTPESIAL